MTLKTMKRYVYICFCMATLLLALASCASKKAAVGEGATSHHATGTEQYAKEHFAAKVFDNQVYTQNIVGNMSFNLTTVVATHASHVYFGKQTVFIPTPKRHL